MTMLVCHPRGSNVALENLENQYLHESPKLFRMHHNIVHIIYIAINRKIKSPIIIHSRLLHTCSLIVLFRMQARVTQIIQ